jgi:bacillithiol system protein YtxJ
MALRRFEDANKNLKVPCYLLNIIENRELSNFISSKYAVVHQSPQVLWIKNGVCENNISHSEITANWLQGCIGK